MISAPLPETAAAPSTPGSLPAPWRLGLAALLLMLAAGLAWQGGAWAMSGLLAAVSSAGLALAGRAPSPSPAAVAHRQPSIAEAGGRQGADLMVAQVIPVWRRQMEVTRDSAADGLAQVLQAFSEMTGALQTLTSGLESAAVAAAPGAIDQAVRGEAGALERLTTASRRAFAERDASVAELSHAAQALAELQPLAKQAREIARHTRLVAFNAAIEANRQQGGRDSGSQSVASEVRMLAARLAEVSEQIEQRVDRLTNRLKTASRQGQLADTSPEELALEIDLQARDALQALLVAVGASLQGSAEVRQASQTLGEQLDAAFVHFQFGDRISQMLSILGSDMDNFVRWVAAHPDASQDDAAEWLASLETSYTMEEQRSHHHGNVHVKHDAGVEFF
jgi:methyl-accepting chemotaxis protein